MANVVSADTWPHSQLFQETLKHIFLNWHTTDAIESRSRFNDIAVYQLLIRTVLFMCVL